MSSAAEKALAEARRREREMQADPKVRRLIDALLVGPLDPALYAQILRGAKLMRLGLELMRRGLKAAGDETPRRELRRPNSLAAFRLGDRLTYDDAEIWTDLADGAAVEVEMLLDSFFLRDVLDYLRRMTPAGLRAAGRRELLLMIMDLTAEERTALMTAARKTDRKRRPARLDPKAQRRFARALHQLAEEIESDAEESR